MYHIYHLVKHWQHLDLLVLLNRPDLSKQNEELDIIGIRRGI